MSAVPDPPEPRVVEGVEVRPAGDGATWWYVPSRPTIERTASGAPQLSLIEAGPVAFLQVTLRLALPDDARARLVQALQADDPAVTDVQPARIAVDRLALEVMTGDWTTLAEGAGSAASPWNAALTATPGPDAVAALKAALAGEAGRARLVARFEVLGAPASVAQASVHAEAQAEATAATTRDAVTGSATVSVDAELDASVEASGAEVHEAVADLADTVRDPIT